MSSVNKVILVGNLGKDPELRHTANQTAVCNFSVATSSSYTDKQGKKVEETEWHDVVVWQKMAENCHKFLKKGSKVFVCGRLKTESYDDKQGVKKFTKKVIADEVTFLSAKSDGDEGGRTGGVAPVTNMDDIPF